MAPIAEQAILSSAGQLEPEADRSRRPSLRRFSCGEPVLARRGIVAVSLVGPFRALLSTGLARAVAMVGWGSVGRRPVGLGQPPARSSVV